MDRLAVTAGNGAVVVAFHYHVFPVIGLNVDAAPVRLVKNGVQVREIQRLLKQFRFRGTVVNDTAIIGDHITAGAVQPDGFRL